MFTTKGGSTQNVPPLGSAPIKYLLGLPRESGFGSGSTAGHVAAGWDGAGKVALITGATAGLGLESARVLASHGCEVVMAVRSKAKAEAAMAAIRQQVPDAKLSFIECELGSLRSVKACADAFKKTGKPLHILLANAGIMATPFLLSEDGYELQWATNHLGHFLLVDLLLDLMVTTATASGVQGRIVVLTSFGHSFATKNEERFAQVLTKHELASPDGYTDFGDKGYGRSKASNVLFARQLNENLAGKPVIAVACHPGFIMDTELSKHMARGLPEPLRQFVLRTVGVALGRLLGKSIPQGAATQVYLATAPPGVVVGGEYYADVNIEKSSVATHSKRLARQLWDVSQDICAPYLK